MPFDVQGSRGRSDRDTARKYGAHRTGGRRSAHRRRRPGTRDMVRPVPAGFTRDRTVAGPPVFVPSAARHEMTRDGYRLLVRPRTLRRSIAGRAAARFPFDNLEPVPPVMNTWYSELPCHPESESIRSCPVTIGKKTLHCTLNVCC
ncbi:hypothetical protein [Burkholderia sp. LMG 32019]|uniref:hypothetical protein n=1 Tax=Burkholderia sp. LMG 32019 TaxID=3158173 RepID=UPI003C2F5B3E